MAGKSMISIPRRRAAISSTYSAETLTCGTGCRGLWVCCSSQHVFTLTAQEASTTSDAADEMTQVGKLNSWPQIPKHGEDNTWAH